jgi:GTP1/Obg family GTP-binding protein
MEKRMDITTRIVNAFQQTDDVGIFRSAVMHILCDDRLPAYQEQEERLAKAEIEIKRLRNDYAMQLAEADAHGEIVRQLRSEIGRLHALCAARPRCGWSESDGLTREFAEWVDKIDAAAGRGEGAT